MTLNEVMKDTADAIREKTGKSDLIAPVDFAEEIKGITAGGGDAPSAMEYWDVSALSAEEKPRLFQFCTMMVNVKGNVIGAAAVGTAEIQNLVTKIATIPSFEIMVDGQKISVSQICDVQGWSSRIVRITKEQFYDLNA